MRHGPRRRRYRRQSRQHQRYPGCASSPAGTCIAASMWPRAEQIAVPASSVCCTGPARGQRSVSSAWLSAPARRTVGILANSRRSTTSWSAPTIKQFKMVSARCSTCSMRRTAASTQGLADTARVASLFAGKILAASGNLLQPHEAAADPGQALCAGKSLLSRDARSGYVEVDSRQKAGTSGSAGADQAAVTR